MRNLTSGVNVGGGYSSLSHNSNTPQRALKTQVPLPLANNNANEHQQRLSNALPHVVVTHNHQNSQSQSDSNHVRSSVPNSNQEPTPTRLPQRRSRSLLLAAMLQQQKDREDNLEQQSAVGLTRQAASDRIDRLDSGRGAQDESAVEDQTPFVGFGPPLRPQYIGGDTLGVDYRGLETNSQYSYYQQFYRQQQEARNLIEMLQTTKLRPAGRDKQRKQEDAEITTSPIFHSFVRPCAAEFLGTIIYVYFTSFGRPLSPRPSELVCVGIIRAACTLISMLLFGHISGGHFNPAITLTSWISGGIKTVLLIFFIIAQFFGAFIAALLVRVSLSYQAYDDVVGGMTYVPIDELTIRVTDTAASNSPSRLQAIFIELVITYGVCLAYSMTVIDTDGRCGYEGPISVASAILLGTVAAYPSTRASMNPAKSFACACVYAIFRPETMSWDYHYVYWFGPLVGALLAACTYRFLFACDDKRVLFTRDLIKSSGDGENDSKVGAGQDGNDTA